MRVITDDQRPAAAQRFHHRGDGQGVGRRRALCSHAEGNGPVNAIDSALRLAVDPRVVLSLLRANGYRTYIVTGGGQDFVRSYAERVYGIGPAQVIGSTLDTKYGYDAKGQGVLLREPKVELNNNFSGKAEDIYLFTGQRPLAAFGNSTGDRQMLEWTTAGAGKRLGMLVLHDDAVREYAYGPAAGLPDTKVGTFTQALLDEAKQRGWLVISMKDDWKRIFAFEP